MNKLVLLLALATCVVADNVPGWQYGYMKKYGIPAAERIREREEQIMSGRGRIAGGEATTLGQIPYVAGLIADIVGSSTPGVCGGSILTPSRILTAAHCWDDGSSQAWRYTVVVGSQFLFFGGSRIRTAAVAIYEKYDPFAGINDVSVVFLPIPVQFSAHVSAVALPSGSLLTDDLTGMNATVAGYGIDRDGAPIAEQYLRHITVSVMSNAECARYYLWFLQPNHTCSYSNYNRGPCDGDLGTGLVVNYNGRPTQIGILSIIFRFECQDGLPAVFTQVAPYLSFINRMLN